MADTNPYPRFLALFARAQKSNLREPTAVTLATADKSGRPQARTVLIKKVDERGFVFYTNLTSRKGRHLLSNPLAALCFYWQPLGEQVLVEGKVTPVSDEEADAYWATRPRLSQLGAWASLQSKPLSTRLRLLQQVAVYTKKFAGQKVPRPPHWSGFRLTPHRFDFLSLSTFRLHERRVFFRAGNRWASHLLYP